MKLSLTNPIQHSLQLIRPFSGPTMTIISVNITAEKDNILEKLCKTSECDVMCCAYKKYNGN